MHYPELRDYRLVSLCVVYCTYDSYPECLSLQETCTHVLQLINVEWEDSLFRIRRQRKHKKYQKTQRLGRKAQIRRCVIRVYLTGEPDKCCYYRR